MPLRWISEQLQPPDSLSPGGAGVTYTYSGSPSPTIIALTPYSGPLASGNTVSITGTHLNHVTSVTVGGSSAPVFPILSQTAITVTPPTGSSATAASLTIPDGTTPASSSYTYLAVPAPSVDIPNHRSHFWRRGVRRRRYWFNGNTECHFRISPGCLVDCCW
ncbi:hypothetical protein N7539_007460 [Penicillium diatomitis]|uniref:IPT/TIG domain-containing protein n=1 Tax=Penicillium diatomitis TaxID=2819901 RepID=A0A9W9WW21_9EURO|nr:uncharacterized protein N7539_007460 [Penicillium diatomitis]KAJ5477316.1 hypothetical protein N7539_007460 [Penicillium diatomitis]